ncbi:multidrug ABC transporter ATP-binding protein [Prochlorococcus marinus str. XMU1401]|uniref:ABC transporter ATP-binding protein n=1 Tax=Prochlorococcus marinus str. XMU1401 TaxID=2052594 RepID=A0A8I2BL51_PROMR|nr:ABC transporter ATP-binding protein [Prochlorococcus marinus]MBO8223263.1 ABC transporter ATP-binding protein [Prochlorococcus marinus str. XMU1401]MBW3059795.1 multidrug ABC transporter ATP-binding protein [Prochlorococcus marinus str. XMU1401E]MCQ9198979.1 ABC transporter ATP-binding protein/permease [Prochlorococcus marinus XMU1429]PJC83611.1 multidrug ABC transporter ATP-binding protein [Prochlorococcus marinus str. XMU1401]
MSSETIRLVRRLLKKLSFKTRRSLLTLLPIAIITGLIDLVVVALVSRVFTAVVGQENKPPIPFSDLITTDPLTKALLLISAYVLLNWLASFSKILLRAKQERLRASVFLELSNIAQKNVLTQKYEFFLTDDSEDLSSKILLNISRVSEKLIRPILQIVSGFFIVTFIFIAIISFAKITALYLMISLVISYLGISLLVTPFIRKATKERINLESEINKVMTESIRTIIDVHLSGSEKFFQERHHKAGKVAFPFLWRAETYPELPRALIEPLGITLIFSIGLFPLFSKNSPTNLLEIVPFLATIAVASLKLTPPLQDLFRGITDLRAGLPDVKEALSIIELKEQRKYLKQLNKPSRNKLEIPKQSIILENLSYKYPNSDNYALKNINIKIPIGQKIAFIGKTGSGKTTIANQILCLLRPTSGHLLVDNNPVEFSDIERWQSFCSYVPQSINLLNGDILSNIAYGLNEYEIDENKVWESIKAAQIEELINNLPEKLKTKVGENGIRLSGGQRQRIAIARAFYRNTKIIVMDEATSALDNKTESNLIKAISNLNKDFTFIFIAHRISTIKECDCIYEFKNGQVAAFGKYDELLVKSESFREIEKNNSSYF